MKTLNKLTIKNFGPIREARLTFGDLTVFIGSQASGKSLALQLLKLLLDKRFVTATMDKYNYVIAQNPDNVLNFFFGEGLSCLWTTDTQISDGTKKYVKNDLLGKTASNAAESLFYIPAQRIISIADGRPKNFMEYDSSTPFVLRQFSEMLRMFIQFGINGNKIVFPLRNRLMTDIKKSFQENVFHKGKVVIDDSSGQKKMQLSLDNMNIPFMAWSAGQKEFMPLLMAFYCLTGPLLNALDCNHYRYVVLEEPEMALHPKAIQSVLLQIIELMQNGYKVFVSTHSQLFLEFAWAFNTVKGSDASPEQKEKMFLKMFAAEHLENIVRLAKGIFEKSVNTYFFADKGEGVVTQDISNLDVASDDQNMADWGGLSQFSDKASEVVSQVINGEYE